MFGNSSPSSRFLTQEAGLYRASMVKYQKRSENMEIIVGNISGDFAIFKAALLEATSAYLKNIENKLFRGSGRKRAQIFQNQIMNAESMSALIPALGAVIKKGNEEDDSLKTYLFKGIHLKFIKNNSNIKEFSILNYTDFLQDIVRGINKRLEPICMEPILPKAQKKL